MLEMEKSRKRSKLKTWKGGFDFTKFVKAENSKRQLGQVNNKNEKIKKWKERKEKWKNEKKEWNKKKKKSEVENPKWRLD